VVRQGQPVTDLAASDVTVRAKSGAVRVTRLDGPNRAPLRIGFATDLSSESLSDLPWISAMLERLARRGDQDRGDDLVVNRTGWTTDWGVNPRETGKYMGADGAGGLASVLRSSLAAFDGVKGRMFLVLVSDGRSSREGLRAALHAAKLAGVPVLVAGIWNRDFKSGARKDLRRLADVTGGSVFFLQGRSQSDDLLERFGRVLDGSYSVLVDAPPGTTDIEVGVTGGEAMVWASATVR
jgi:hypothetical protein